MFSFEKKTQKILFQVLQSFKIMDYSLLVGIHNLELAASNRRAR